MIDDKSRERVIIGRIRFAGGYYDGVEQYVYGLHEEGLPELIAVMEDEKNGTVYTKSEYLHGADVTIYRADG